MRALALIDGEHYAPVVKAALEELPYDFVAAHVVGGTEKLRGDADYGVGVGARGRYLQKRLDIKESFAMPAECRP